MISFYLWGSVLSAIIYILGDYYSEDEEDIIPNQRYLLFMLVMCLSWLGVLGTIFDMLDKKGDK
jgi:hypothetical protein